MKNLTSYEFIPVGTNSGALAERVDAFAKESTSLHPLEEDILLAFALCWGLTCLRESGRRRETF